MRLDWWPHLKIFIWVSYWIEYVSASIYCYICCFLTTPFLYVSPFTSKCIQLPMLLLVPFLVRLDWWPHLKFLILVSNWIDYFSASLYCYICCFLTMPFLYFSHFIIKCIVFNAFTGSIPSEIGLLTSLTNLYLSK